MKIIETAALNFIGQPFPDSMMDKQRTFTKINSQMEDDIVFKDFLKTAGLMDQRASMVIFGPSNFMYWYGVIVNQKISAPKNLMQFELPSAEIAVEQTKGQLNSFDLPLNFVVPDFFTKIAIQGVKVFENPGDSETPYLLQKLDLANQKLQKIWYVKKSK